MSSRDRREFLKKSALAVTAIGLPSCSPTGQSEDASAGTELTNTELRNTRSTNRADGTLDPVLLRTVSDVVLPSELGSDGREAAVNAFETWLAGFAPVAERPHPYLAPEITYGPPDPAPGWNAQLTALDLESRQRHGAGLAEVEQSLRERLIRAQIDGGGGLPDPARAGHVAVGLMAHFFRSSIAVDLSYDARIGKQTCRGLDGLKGSPAPERLSDLSADSRAGQRRRT